MNGNGHSIDYPTNGAEDPLSFLKEVYRANAEPPGTFRQRLRRVRAMLALEVSEMHFAFDAANLFAALFPTIIARRLRPALYRRLGMNIGHRVTALHAWSMTAMGKPYGRLTIGDDLALNGTRFFLNAPVRIGKGVVVSEGTLISTDRHEVGPPSFRMGQLHSRPVTIGDGVWIQRRVMILGANVGEGAIVAGGSIVTKDVPPNTFVAGSPAHVVRELPTDETSVVRERATVAETSPR